MAIPIILAILGWSIQDTIAKRSTSQQYVELAVNILTKADRDIDPGIRVWAVDLLNDNSPTRLSLETENRLKSGEIKLVSSTFKDFTVTVTKVWPIDTKFFTPDPGNKLIALDLIIENTSNSVFEISNIFTFELEDENGTTYSSGAIATAAIGKKLPTNALAPGQQVNLSIGFELPNTLKKVWLQYFWDDETRIELEIP